MRKARTDAELTVRAIANVMGVSERTVYNWETDHTHPNRAVLVLWAHVTRVELGWLDGSDNHARVISLGA